MTPPQNRHMTTAPNAPSHSYVDVLIVGAGISGIDAAYRISTEHPERSY